MIFGTKKVTLAGSKLLSYSSPFMHQSSPINK